MLKESSSQGLKYSLSINVKDKSRECLSLVKMEEKKVELYFGLPGRKAYVDHHTLYAFKS